MSFCEVHVDYYCAGEFLMMVDVMEQIWELQERKETMEVIQ